MTSAQAYLEEIPACLTFPVRKDVFILLAGTAFVVWPISAMVSMPGNFYGFIGVIIQFGLEASLLLHLIRQVAHDTDEIQSPDFTTIIDDLGYPLLKYTFACLPMIIALMWAASVALGDWLSIDAISSKEALHAQGPGLLWLLGFLLLPITSLLAALSGSANPLEWYRTIRSIGSPLWVGAPAFYGYILIGFLVILPLADKLHAIPIIGRLFALLITYMALAIRARLLGSLILGRI